MSGHTFFVAKFHTTSLLLCLLLTSQCNAERIACDGIIFNDVYYDKEVLFTKLGRPYNLVMHKFSGLLFFSHTVQNTTHVDFAITSCHIVRKDCHNVSGIPGGYAIAYDPGNDDIYLGGHDGIYKYNFLTKSAEFFAEEGKSVWGLFVKRNFYYIEYPSQKLHVYQNDDFVPVYEARNIEIDHFFISKHMDIYFSNRTALYKVERPKNEALLLNDEVAIRQIVEDGYGDIYFCASDGIYIEDKPFLRTKRVAHINQAFGITFDEHDNIIYSDEQTIYRLVTSKHGDLCYKAITKPKENRLKVIEMEFPIS